MVTDHGENYEYVYDAFNRLRKVKNTSTQALVAEYRYNGLNYRITSHEDTDGNGTVDGSDTILHFAYDERWRIVAVFEDSSSDPHEEFVHHNAGDSGFGTSSYIDAVVLRDRDADGDINHDLEERRYYCQNWRHDVVALVTDTGKLVEQVRYDAYGKMTGFASGDTDSDGDFDATDSSNITGLGGYDVRKDADLDGDADSADVTHANSITGGYQTLGRGVLSSTGVVNVVGYASYTSDRGITGGFWHVRYRVLDSALGRWLTRDPYRYVDGANLYSYLGERPLIGTDPSGLAATICGGRPRCRTGSAAAPGSGVSTHAIDLKTDPMLAAQDGPRLPIKEIIDTTIDVVPGVLEELGQNGITVKNTPGSIDGIVDNTKLDGVDRRVMRRYFPVLSERGVDSGIDEFMRLNVRLYVKWDGCDLIYVGVGVEDGDYIQGFWGRATVTGQPLGREDPVPSAVKCCEKAGCLEYKVRIEIDFRWYAVGHNDVWATFKYKVCGDGSVKRTYYKSSDNWDPDFVPIMRPVR